MTSGPAQAVPAARRGEAYGQGFVTVNDGVTLRYLEVGSGAPLVFVPGWSQTAEQWKFQLEHFGRQYHVFALDMRGHGESEKPQHGYRVARLAADLHDFMLSRDLHDVMLVAHSMGCSVLWSYLELYGPGRLRKLVLTDQMPAIVARPQWSAEQREETGSILDAAQVLPLVEALAGPDGEATTAAFLQTMFSKEYPPQDFDWAMARNLDMPREHAAALLYDHAFKDWRDVIARITLPTLVIGGKVSNVPWTAMVWIGRAIKGARTEIFEEHEGGSHFMFIENPQKYNAIVEDFLTQSG